MDSISEQILRNPYKSSADHDWLVKHTSLTLKDIENLRLLEDEYLREYKKN